MTDANTLRMRLLALPLLVVFAVLVVWPLTSIVIDSFDAQGEISLANYRTVLESTYYRQSFVTSLWISVLTTGIGIALGILLAIALRARGGGVRRFALAFGSMGANFAGVPLAMAIIILFGMNGFFTILVGKLGLPGGFNVYSLAGLVIAYCYFQIALATLLLTPAFDAVPAEIEEAAALMGVSSARFWLRVGLPIVARQIVAIAILLFANAMGTFATTYALTGTSVNVVTIAISDLVSGDIFSDPNLANAIALVLLVVLLVPIVASQFLARERRP
ncbi:putative spermidine/putrescine transport system permease protein [Pseudochelatococcus lubricantis]|uniref:Spermidine/putrescine transport system permease protein n=1 Tax=Pseudochelatococcus lubricantis TaxID=1538102 RepID=A0ABX0V177_9HYPH|nr:ABC transporter permease subunit [Pseudochelatococcus lubricantis]NIJ58953.1 putative spermidine/putrescine transport system permease protein [Pseudochelatococcus lubricantis]